MLYRTCFATALVLLIGVTACNDGPVAPEASSPTGMQADALPGATVEPHVYEFSVPTGSLLLVNLPGNPGGGGFIGTMSDPTSGREIGQFVTDILPSEGTDIFAVLGTLMSTGSASVSAVRGTFETRSGSIVDRHNAELFVAGPATTPGYEVVVDVRGAGVITEGSRKYNRDGGSSVLTLRMEVDAEGLLPTLAISGSFHFILD